MTIEGGAAVDIQTGAPIELARELGNRQKAEADELVGKMRMAGLSETEAAAKVAALVTRVLEGLIGDFLKKNPRAQVCVEILRAINAPALTAQEAAKRYVGRTLRRPNYRP